MEDMPALNASEIRKLISILDNVRFAGMQEYRLGTALGVSIPGIKSISFGDGIKSLVKGIINDFSLVCEGYGRSWFVFPHFKSYIESVPVVYKLYNISYNIPDSRVYHIEHRNCLDLTGLSNAFRYIVWLAAMRSLPLKFGQRLYLAGQIGQCRKWHSQFSREIKADVPGMVTTYCDSHIYDNISTQCCRLMSITTATFQHGLYPAASDKVFSDGYELFLSDTLHAWGEQSRDAAIQSKIDQSRINVAGRVIKTERLTGIPDSNAFGVMLSGNMQDEGRINTQLIELAEGYSRDTGSRYILKPHPFGSFKVTDLCDGNCLEIVDRKDFSLRSLAEKVEFFICPSTSTIAFDLINMGAVVFVCINQIENHFDPYLKGLCFNELEELSDLVEWYRSNKMEYERLAASIDEFVFSDGAEQAYIEFYGG